MTLAIDGGRPVRRRPFPLYNSIGPEEKRAALEVLDSGILSDFVGAKSPLFEGGPRVRRFEEEWAARLGVRRAVSVNSATSALIAAVAACGVGPGDEVIVPPYTMSATAASVRLCGAKPVFADIEPRTFCLDPAAARRAITPRTKAIIAVDLFGQAADWEPLRSLARRRGLRLIEDASQAPGASYRGRPCGAWADIGVFSLNCHKHIQTGEGGLAVTDDEDLARRLLLLRNHGENVVSADEPRSLRGLVGFNFRLTELGAAIGSEQLKKLSSFNRERQDRAAYLNGRLSRFPGIEVPALRPGCDHVFYLQPFLLDPARIKMSRDRFVDALAAEGIKNTRGRTWGKGYVRPLYRLGAFGGRTSRGLSVVEGVESRITVNPFVFPPLARRDLDDIVDAVEKVLGS